MASFISLFIWFLSSLFSYFIFYMAS